MSAEPEGCREVLERLPWLVNGSLRPDEERAVRGHLQGCPSCRDELGATHRALAIATAHVPAEELVDYGFDAVPSAAIRAEIARHVARCAACADELQRVIASRAAHDEHPPAGAETRPRAQPDRWTFRLAWAAAVAAAIVAAAGLTLWREAEARAERWRREAQAFAARPPAEGAPAPSAGSPEPSVDEERLRSRLLALEAPRVNAPLFELEPLGGPLLRSGPLSAAQNVVAWDGDPMVTFVLLAPPEPARGPHTVVLLEADGRVVWRGDGLWARPGGDFAVALPASRLPKGAFTLRVERRGAAPLIYPVRVDRR